MSELVTSSRRRLFPGLLLLFFILTILLPAPVAHAQGGIALAGTFHLQEYELPQGTEIGNPSIYLVVFNHGDEPMNISMRIDAPFGVEVLLDETEFTLEPHSDRKLFITVKATENAAPGEYDLIVTAQSSPAGDEASGTGARLATASAQKASLVVTGASARAKFRVLTTDGRPIEAQVRLFKMIEDRLNDISISETGIMDIKLAPGGYRVIAYIAGRKLAEEEFEIEADETVEFDLIVRTAYFEQFGIEPNYLPDTDQLNFVRMVYTINNLADPLDDVEGILTVMLDGKFLEQVSLITLGRLDLGRTGGSASYIPAAGWQPGHYTFKLDLTMEGEFYIESNVQELSVTPEDVSASGVTKPSILRKPFGIEAPSPAGISLFWWILTVVIFITVVTVFWLRRRPGEEPEKPAEEAPPAEEEEAAEVTEEEAELPEEEAEEVAEEEAPPLLEEQVEAEDVPEGEIEEPPEMEWEEEAEDVPEGEIEEPPEVEVEEGPPERETGVETEDASSEEEVEEYGVEEPGEDSEEEDKPTDQ